MQAIPERNDNSENGDANHLAVNVEVLDSDGCVRDADSSPAGSFRDDEVSDTEPY